MSKKNPHRSRKGCFTCKSRKKKCDETRPRCRRCIDGGFDCLGYSHPSTSTGSKLAAGIEEPMSLETLDVPAPLERSRNSGPILSVGSWMGSGSSVSLWAEMGGAGTHSLNSIQVYRQARPNIPRGIQFDPLEVENMISFVVLQASRFPSNVSLRSLPFSIQHALSQYLKTSSHIRWSMYIGARIGQAISDGTSWYHFIGWMNEFCGRMLSLSIDSHTESTDIDIRLKSLQNFAGPSFAALGSFGGYMLHKQNLPLFLQLATRFPEVWTNDYEISISQALHSSDSAISQFIFTDTVTALVFAIPPLVCYDTTISPEDWRPPSSWSGLDRIHGWPAAVLILFAKINSLGVARRLHQSPLSESERVDIEKEVRDWKPVIDHDIDSSGSIVQLVVQECWRHTLLIYMYMAACGVDSADPQVETLVQQVYLLVNTIEDENLSGEHLFIPCLVAGVAARKEKHRRLFHKRIPTRRRVSQFLLQGFDFIPVLDHLWHGAASEGRAVVWDDYVNSRSSIIPIHV